jgi:hypothetical protein
VTPEGIATGFFPTRDMVIDPGSLIRWSGLERFPDRETL